MTRSPGRRRGSRPPHTPADTTRGAPKPSNRSPQRSAHRAAPRPTGASRSASRPYVEKENRRRSGSSSSRATARASRSTAVRIRTGFTARRSGCLVLLPLASLHPGLPAIARRRVLSGELDVRDLRVAQRERPVSLLVEILEEGLGHQLVPVEDVADHFGAVRLDDGGVAPIVEGEIDDL